MNTTDTAKASCASGLHLAYLVSRYPAVSHTFILREVSTLQRMGARIEVASVNAPDRSTDRMTGQEREAAGATYYLKRAGVRGALAGALHCARHYPAGCLNALRASLTLGHGLRRLYALGYLAEAMMIVRWMDARELRHLHVHFATAGANVGLLARALAPIGLSMTVHGPDEFDDVAGQHLRAKLQAAELVVCISQFARSQLMRLVQAADWPRLRVCRLGVLPGAAQASGSKQPDGKRVASLLCVGRLTPAKGQHILLEACAWLAARGHAFHLTLVGHGADEASLRRAVTRHGLANHVTFAGALNENEVREAMEQADLFVLPSLAEGIPVVLMEAMANGVPCVSSPVNGIPELIEHGVSGMLCTPGDSGALAAAIASLLGDADARTRLGAAGRARVRAEFDLERNVARLAQLFATLQTTRPEAQGGNP